MSRWYLLGHRLIIYLLWQTSGRLYALSTRLIFPIPISSLLQPLHMKDLQVSVHLHLPQLCWYFWLLFPSGRSCETLHHPSSIGRESSGFYSIPTKILFWRTGEEAVDLQPSLDLHFWAHFFHHCMTSHWVSKRCQLQTKRQFKSERICLLILSCIPFNRCFSTELQILTLRSCKASSKCSNP